MFVRLQQSYLFTGDDGYWIHPKAAKKVLNPVLSSVPAGLKRDRVDYCEDISLSVYLNWWVRCGLPHFSVINMELYTMCAAREKQTRSVQNSPLNRRIENPGEILSSGEVQCSVEFWVSLNPQICCDFHIFWYFLCAAVTALVFLTSLSALL